MTRRSLSSAPPPHRPSSAGKKISSWERRLSADEKRLEIRTGKRRIRRFDLVCSALENEQAGSADHQGLGSGSKVEISDGRKVSRVPESRIRDICTLCV